MTDEYQGQGHDRIWFPDDPVCVHGTALDVHCCNCHSGFLFDIQACYCTTPPRCGWWNRWLHRRRREADVLYLLPAFQLAALQAGHDLVAAESYVDRAFELHKTLPGEEHWRCACSQNWE